VAEKGRDNAAKAAGVSPSRMSQALLAKEHHPDVAHQVIAGKIFLDATYALAQCARKK
jgi:hypothetical protein